MTGKGINKLIRRHIYFQLETILKKYIDDNTDIDKARDEILSVLNDVLF